MEYPLIVDILINFISLLLENQLFLLLIIPKLLQLIGMGGWLWHGYQLSNTRLTMRIRNFTRSTLTWLSGIFLEFFIRNYIDWLL